MSVESDVKRAREAAERAIYNSGDTLAIVYLADAVKELADACDDLQAQVAELRGDSPGLEH